MDGNPAARNAAHSYYIRILRGNTMNKPALPPIRRTDRPSALKGAPGWASMLRTRAGSHADDPALTAVIQTHQRLVDGWDALEQVRQNRNPKHTAAQHLDVVGKSAK